MEKTLREALEKIAADIDMALELMQLVDRPPGLERVRAADLDLQELLAEFRAQDPPPARAPQGKPAVTMAQLLEPVGGLPGPEPEKEPPDMDDLADWTEPWECRHCKQDPCVCVDP